MDNRVIKLENKIVELETRLKQLEKIEKRRKIKKYITIGIKTLIWLIIIICLYSRYLYIKENYFDKYEATINRIEEKYNELKKFNIKDLFPANN